jgi:hypothetical protein
MPKSAPGLRAMKEMEEQVARDTCQKRQLFGRIGSSLDKRCFIV